MPDPLQECYDCGCQGEAAEFQQRRIRQPKRSGAGKVYLNVWLCPECTARYDAAPAAKIGRCDRCEAAIESGAGQVRFRTETEQVGRLARHHSVTMILCPECTASYDGAGSHLIRGLLVVVGILMLLTCAGLIFGSR